MPTGEQHGADARPPVAERFIAELAEELGLQPVSRFEEAVGLVRELVIADRLIRAGQWERGTGFTVLEESAARARAFLAKIDGEEPGGYRDGK